MKEMILTYLKALIWHSPGRSGENNPQFRIPGYLTDTRINTPQTLGHGPQSLWDSSIFWVAENYKLVTYSRYQIYLPKKDENWSN